MKKRPSYTGPGECLPLSPITTALNIGVPAKPRFLLISFSANCRLLSQRVSVLALCATSIQSAGKLTRLDLPEQACAVQAPLWPCSASLASPLHDNKAAALCLTRLVLQAAACQIHGGHCNDLMVTPTSFVVLSSMTSSSCSTKLPCCTRGVRCRSN